MTKLEALKALEGEMEADKSLPLSMTSYLVFGEGSPEADVMFIGEAPGFHEDRLRRPFVGTAGKLLDKLILEVGWKREGVYITNIVKRRPPENRDPLPEEIEAYKPYLTRQIEIINPKAIVPLGRYGMNYFLPEAKISRDQGKVFWVEGRKIIPMFHPAAALRAGAVLETLRQSFRKLPELLKVEEPPKETPTALGDVSKNDSSKETVKAQTLF
ncbi:MAG: uracil-DNA glycosylase [Candidatus Sungbacteria bacterium]|uniref:Type-4 uracil-DNA glycosylase n=1 Tax=Candidatus Sungiibacteriota bacterium TaxID=2750080 RepID=A0A931SC74_9BACT|nr:uracil-DNA glycosylase [Candidatus Sungbacteria bacterium]